MFLNEFKHSNMNLDHRLGDFEFTLFDIDLVSI
jgi:hypothetical protein